MDSEKINQKYVFDEKRKWQKSIKEADVKGAINSGKQNWLKETKWSEYWYFLVLLPQPRVEDVHKIQGFPPQKRVQLKERELTTRISRRAET